MKIPLPNGHVERGRPMGAVERGLMRTSLSKVLSSLGGLGLSNGAEAAVTRLCEAAGLSETGLLLKTGVLQEEADL